MKRYIFTVLILSCLGGAATAQTEAQQELKAYMNEGLVNWESPDKNFTFRVGGRVMLDGAHYLDDYTDRGSGVRFGEARIRLFSTFGRKLDFKFDVDLAPSRATLKDVYLRWHTNPHGFLKVGNFVEPFSAENIQSTFDDHFISKSATIEALGTGRTIGVSYRYYHKYAWAEGGVFSQKYNSESTKGDMGYGLSARALGRWNKGDFNIHLGGSVNYRRPDANGFTNGSDDYNRYVLPVSPLESTVDKTPFLGGRIDNVKKTFKYALELMASYRQFYLTGEYIHSKNDREKDWEYNFKSSLGTFMSTMAPTLEAYKKLYGGDTPVEQKGYSVQAGWLILGGDYQYNRVDALMGRPGAGSLELVLRYNHTDLNDLKGGSYYNGKFYDNSLYQSFGLANGSFIGGKATTYTVGVNYYVTRNVMVKFNYGYTDLDNQYSLTYNLDKKMHSLHLRLGFEF